MFSYVQKMEAGIRQSPSLSLPLFSRFRQPAAFCCRLPVIFFQVQAQLLLCIYTRVASLYFFFRESDARSTNNCCNKIFEGLSKYALRCRSFFSVVTANFVQYP